MLYEKDEKSKRRVSKATVIQIFSLLLTKYSQIGNETFPDWEQMLSHRFAVSIQPLS